MNWRSSDWVGRKDKKEGEKNTALLFQEAPKPCQFCRGKTFEKNRLRVFARAGGCTWSQVCRDPPQPGLPSARSPVPPPSAESHLPRLGEPSPKSLWWGSQRGQTDFLFERRLRSHLKPPLVLKANFFGAVRPQALLLALAVAAMDTREA